MILSKYKFLGPGLLYAAAAVGVSHLVQSTRAGASFGNQLIWVIILANLIKLPAFEASKRYVHAKKESLLGGYEKIGKWALVLFLLLTISTMFIIQSAITIVTAGLIQNLTGIVLGAKVWAVITIFFAVALITIGGNKAIDKMTKLIIFILSFSTLLSCVFAYFSTFPRPMPPEIFSFENQNHILFLVAFAGWMPAPLDISVWQSIWAIEKSKSDQDSIFTYKEKTIDFYVGYIGTIVLALLFLQLGNMVMYRSGIELPTTAVSFASKLIGLYTETLGDWSYLLVAIAAFTTMFSTTITCLDAFPKVIIENLERLKIIKSNSYKLPNQETHRKKTIAILLLVALGSLGIIFFMMQNMKTLVDFATTVAFMTAPLVAFLNYKLVSNKELLGDFAVTGKFKIISIICLFLLTLFSFWYLMILFK